MNLPLQIHVSIFLYKGWLARLFIGIYLNNKLYSVFFFIELKVFVNLTYLYYTIRNQKARSHFLRRNGAFDNLPKKNLDLDRGFLSKLVFLLYVCRESV